MENSINEKFVIELQGKSFILFEGLLDLFHQNGGKSIKTEIASSAPLIIQATAEGEKGIFQGIGDADDNNTNSMISKHKIRMAETRAIARALRWYNNIGMCSLDELGGDDKPKYKPVQNGISKEPAGVHGKCQHCGSDKIQNPKTGKVFCVAKCWLGSSEK